MTKGRSATNVKADHSRRHNPSTPATHCKTLVHITFSSTPATHLNTWLSLQLLQHTATHLTTWLLATLLCNHNTQTKGLCVAPAELNTTLITVAAHCCRNCFCPTDLFSLLEVPASRPNLLCIALLSRMHYISCQLHQSYSGFLPCPVAAPHDEWWLWWFSCCVQMFHALEYSILDSTLTRWWDWWGRQWAREAIQGSRNAAYSRGRWRRERSMSCSKTAGPCRHWAASFPSDRWIIISAPWQCARHLVEWRRRAREEDQSTRDGELTVL